MPRLLSEGLAGLACYNTPASPDRIFGRRALTPEDLGIGKATPARTFVGTPCRSLGPLPARPVPSQNLEHQGKLAHGFTWGAIPHNRKPRFQTASM
jgi:hypothetical protein